MKSARNNRLIFTFFLFCLLSSCQETATNTSDFSWQLISARDQGEPRNRPQIYRALTPKKWIRLDSSKDISIADTKQPICEFYIQANESESQIHLTIHTFPISENTLRIAPQAQISRWKKQFEELDLASTLTLPKSHGGFNGFFFEGQGTMQGAPVKVLGWSMQLAFLYERLLKNKKILKNSFKRADYTIKAMGPPDLINKHRDALLTFAESFELIDELPAPS